MSEKHTCCAPVYSSGSYRSCRCNKGAKYEHEGEWYCKTHHPHTVKANDEARTAKWQAEWDALNQAKEKARAAAAEQKRRADAYDQLVERVKELEEALRDAEEYISGHTPTNSWGLLDKREDADRRDTLEKVRAALSKPLPNTVAEVKP